MQIVVTMQMYTVYTSEMSVCNFWNIVISLKYNRVLVTV